MRKIGITSGAYWSGWDVDFDLAFRKMKGHGFDCVDLSLAGSDDASFVIYQKSEDEFKEILSKLRTAAQKHGIEVYQVHGPWRYPPENSTDEERAKWRSYMERGIYGCHIVGCKNFVVHPIMPFGTDKEPDSEMFYELNYEFFRSLIPTAQKYGVKICIENMPFGAHSIARPGEIADFVKDLDSDVFAMCLDTGHAEILRVTPAESVKIMKEKLRALHVHDNDGKADKHACPFFGVTDWKAFKEAVKEHISEDVPIMFETGPGNSTMPESLKDIFLSAYAEVANFLAN